MTTTTARAPQPEIRPAGGERRRPVLRVVDTRRDGSRRSTAGMVGWLLTGVLFASVFSVVICQVLLVQAQSRLDAVNRDIARESTLGKQQRSDIAGLESPQRIVDEAQQRLGMVASPDVAYLQPDAGDDARAVLPVDAVPTTTRPAPPASAPPTTAPMAVASSGGGRTPAWAPSATTSRSGTAAATTTTRSTAGNSSTATRAGQTAGGTGR